MCPGDIETKKEDSVSKAKRKWILAAALAVVTWALAFPAVPVSTQQGD
jgi:hypothetical protein